jgi:glycosyltransferase involved in cell wall biosynthesis
MLVKGLGIGGAERLISEGAGFWNTDAFDYRVAYVLPWKDQLVPDLTVRGFRVDCLGGSRFGVPLRFRRLLRSYRPDLIHAHLPATGILARLTTGVPVVYTEHNVASSYRSLTRVVNFGTYWRNASAIAVSDAVAASLERYPGPGPVVIPNGVAVSASDEDRRRARAELGIDEATSLVVQVGNIRPWKGHTTLISAVEPLVAAVPDVVVVSIGAEKNLGDLERVRAEARDRGVGDRIHFLGRRPDAVAFVAAADAFVNPSDMEGLPLVVLEAMTLGTPVVATSVGGVPSVIVDGETGLLIPPGRPSELADAVAALLGDRERAAALAGRARTLAVEGYGLERMVRANEAVYTAVLRD